MISEAEILRTARLARIAVSAAEAAELAGDFAGIMDWVEQLNEVDTENVEPMAPAAGAGMRLRDDGLADGGIAGRIVANAPRTEDNLFMVPKVVE